MRRRLLIIAIAIFLVVVIFISSGCSQLSNKESRVNKKFEALVPELVLRYDKLSDAVDIAIEVGGKRDVTNDATKKLKDFAAARKAKNTSEEIKASRELENIIGRLRANALSSPKLKTSQELITAIAAVDNALPGSDNREAYVAAANSYDDQRTSWRYLASSLFGGYKPPKMVEFSLPVDNG
jgi:hypothetical protein